MSTLPRQSVNTAFSPSAYPAGVAAIPARRPAAPAPAEPRSVPAVRPRQRIQTATLIALVVIAFVIVSSGLLYLSGYAQMTGEKYRTVKLQHELKQQREIQRSLKQAEALACAPDSIESQARKIGMIPAADKDMVTVGKPISVPSAQ